MKTTGNYNLPLYEDNDLFDKEIINDTHKKIDKALSDVQDTLNSANSGGLQTIEEVMHARGKFDSLPQRLDNFNSQLEDITNMVGLERYKFCGNTIKENGTISTSCNNKVLSLTIDSKAYNINLPTPLYSVGDVKDELIYNEKTYLWELRHYCRKWNYKSLEGLWSVNSSFSSDTLIEFYANSRMLTDSEDNKSICNIFENDGAENSNGERVTMVSGIWIRVLKSKLNTPDVRGLETYLQNNNFEIITLCNRNKSYTLNDYIYYPEVLNDDIQRYINSIPMGKIELNNEINPIMVESGLQGHNYRQLSLSVLNEDKLVRDSIYPHEKHPFECTNVTLDHGHGLEKVLEKDHEVTVNLFGHVYIQEMRDYPDNAILCVREMKLMIYKKSTQKWEAVSTGRLTGGAFFDHHFVEGIPNIEADISYDNNGYAYIPLNKANMKDRCFHFWGSSYNIKNAEDIGMIAGFLEANIIGNDDYYCINLGCDIKELDGKGYAEAFQSRYRGLLSTPKKVYGCTEINKNKILSLCNANMIDNAKYKKTLINENTYFNKNLFIGWDTEVEARELKSSNGLNGFSAVVKDTDWISKLYMRDIIETNYKNKLYFTSTNGVEGEKATICVINDGKYKKGHMFSADFTVKKINRYGDAQYGHFYFELEKSDSGYYYDVTLLEHSPNFKGELIYASDYHSILFKHGLSDAYQYYVGELEITATSEDLYTIDRYLLIPTFSKPNSWN